MTTSITTTDDGFSVDVAPLLTMRWQDIEKIVAFKRDLFSLDLICLGFDHHDGTRIEVDEEMNGFEDLLVAIGTHFSLPKNWYRDIAFPAFETNSTTIWTFESDK